MQSLHLQDNRQTSRMSKLMTRSLFDGFGWLWMFLLLKVLRPKLVDEKFMKNLGEFLKNVQLLDAGSTRIQSAAGLYLFFAFTTRCFMHILCWQCYLIFIIVIDKYYNNFFQLLFKCCVFCDYFSQVFTGIFTYCWITICICHTHIPNQQCYTDKTDG